MISIMSSTSVCISLVLRGAGDLRLAEPVWGAELDAELCNPAQTARGWEQTAASACQEAGQEAMGSTCSCCTASCTGAGAEASLRAAVLLLHICLSELRLARAGHMCLSKGSGRCFPQADCLPFVPGQQQRLSTSLCTGSERCLFLCLAQDGECPHCARRGNPKGFCAA